MPTLAAFLSLSLCVSPLYAASIKLNDGSVVRGEIVEFSGGVYAIETDSLGQVRVHEREIARISYSDDESDAPGQADQIKSLQRGLILNPGMMDQIQTLTSDKQIQDVLADPQIAAAIQAGDLSALMQNPKFMALLENEALMGVVREAR